MSRKSDSGKIEVYRHGETYSEADEIEKSYPFQLCPECMSQDTVIIKHDKNCCRQTGDYEFERKGILYHKIIFVNHQCNACGCKFQHTFEERSARESIEVDQDIAIWLICALIFVFSLIACICGWTVFDCEDSTPWWLDLWVGASTVTTCVSGAIFWFGAWELR